MAKSLAALRGFLSPREDARARRLAALAVEAEKLPAPLVEVLLSDWAVAYVASLLPPSARGALLSWRPIGLDDAQRKEVAGLFSRLFRGYQLADPTDAWSLRDGLKALNCVPPDSLGAEVGKALMYWPALLSHSTHTEDRLLGALEQALREALRWASTDTGSDGTQST